MFDFKHLRVSLVGAVAALALGAPVAGAAQPAQTDLKVCNQATPTSLGGSLVAIDSDATSPAARFRSERLKQHRGAGRGLVKAAANSAALSVCTDDSASKDETGDGIIDPPPMN